jgi:glutamate dehydrogenase/leucine dehydrogenase
VLSNPEPPDTSGFETHGTLFLAQVHSSKKRRGDGGFRCSAQAADYRSRQPKDVSVLVVGPTGYIGRFVVKELMARGYQVVVFAREKSGVGGKASKEQTIKVGNSPWGGGGGGHPWVQNG